MPREFLYGGDGQEESSCTVRHRVITARHRQFNGPGCLNQQLAGRQLEQMCWLGREVQQLLQQAMDKLDLSARAYHRILRVARTIADLAGDGDINETHVSEAVGYRVLDRIPN